MSRTAEHVPARAGRLWRMLVGEESGGAFGAGPIVDLRDAPGVDPRTVEERLARLEVGVRLIADTLKAVGTQLTGAVRELQAEGRERDQRQRADIERLLWDSVAPLTESVERLAEAVRGIPLVVQSSTERILGHVAGYRTDPPAPAELGDQPEPEAAAAPVEPSDEPPTTPFDLLPVTLPATPFDLEPIEQTPNRAAERTPSGEDPWFWGSEGDPRA